jgi:hypothetical protein
MRFGERILRLVLLGTIVYAAIVLANVEQERFPVFSWSLFSKVPDATRQDYSVRFIEIDGKTLDPPAYFATLKDRIREAESPEAYSLMRQLGNDLDKGRPRAENTRALFEGQYLEGLDSARYQVVDRTFDLKRRFACEQTGASDEDCFDEERVIGEFTIDG